MPEGMFDPMRILVLDDDYIRQQSFLRMYPNDTLVFAQRYWDFISELNSNQEFDLIHLDHDLGNDGDVYTDGWGKTVAFSGKDAVDPLALLVNKPKKVIVHTMNPVVGSRMVSDLKRAGMDARYQPFQYVPLSVEMSL
jgi:hypothetical protein